MLELDREQIAEFCRRNRIMRLELFGSAARGDAGPESDLDFLVEFAPDAHVGFLALGRIREELEALTGRSVDLVPRGGLKPLIRDQVISEARSVYSA